MGDLISRQAAIDAINEYGSVWMEYTETMSVDEIADRALKASKQSMHKILHDLPSVTTAPRMGRWIPVGYDGYADGNPVYDWWECSECEWEHTGDEDTLTPYCPNCGAKMREVDG